MQIFAFRFSLHPLKKNPSPPNIKEVFKMIEEQQREVEAESSEAMDTPPETPSAGEAAAAAAAAQQLSPLTPQGGSKQIKKTKQIVLKKLISFC